MESDADPPNAKRTRSYDHQIDKPSRKRKTPTNVPAKPKELKGCRTTVSLSLSILATQSATARVCNAIMHHGNVLPRAPPGTRRKSRHIGNRLNPVVVFGGGQYASGGNGLASVPRKALIRELGHKTVVVIADEYKTSQMCCKCGTKLTNPDLRPSRRGVRIGEKREFALCDSRRLRQCQSEACSKSESSDDDVKKKYAMHWNRDTNAAINILQVGVEWLLRGVRPANLRRSTINPLASGYSLPPDGGFGRHQPVK